MCFHYPGDGEFGKGHHVTEGIEICDITCLFCPRVAVENHMSLRDGALIFRNVNKTYERDANFSACRGCRITEDLSHLPQDGIGNTFFLALVIVTLFLSSIVRGGL
jgi:hypothetical protein